MSGLINEKEIRLDELKEYILPDLKRDLEKADTEFGAAHSEIIRVQGDLHKIYKRKKTDGDMQNLEKLLTKMIKVYPLGKVPLSVQDWTDWVKEYINKLGQKKNEKRQKERDETFIEIKEAIMNTVPKDAPIDKKLEQLQNSIYHFFRNLDNSMREYHNISYMIERAEKEVEDLKQFIEEEKRAELVRERSKSTIANEKPLIGYKEIADHFSVSESTVAHWGLVKNGYATKRRIGKIETVQAYPSAVQRFLLDIERRKERRRQTSIQ